MGLHRTVAPRRFQITKLEDRIAPCTLAALGAALSARTPALDGCVRVGASTPAGGASLQAAVHTCPVGADLGVHAGLGGNAGVNVHAGLVGNASLNAQVCLPVTISVQPGACSC